jgi:hypothetical protein
LLLEGAAMKGLRKGSDVVWIWGAHEARGKIVERFTSDVRRKIGGKTIKRGASKEDPAFLIKQSDDDIVLKSSSEIKRSRSRGTSA